jgi:phosphohistidine phosphatase
LLLRHAKSSWAGDAASDFDRPLAKRGKQDAEKVGSWLQRQKLVPDLILSSPAKRARKTILAVCRQIPFDAENIRWMPEIYDAGLTDLIKVLNDCPDKANTVLLVGHNPGMEYLLEYLCRDRVPAAADGKLLTTACVANVEIAGKWSHLSESCGRLVSITRPAEME